MHDAPLFHPDPIRSRGQLELELARLAMRLRVACGQLTSGRLRGTGRESRDAIEAWYDEVAADILARSDARIAVYARERLKSLAARLRFAPAYPGTAASAAVGSRMRGAVARAAHH